ncbi:MFS transporter [Dermacoccus sp. SAI-028]|uniref:MFS transporter n=1 Tax=Dermacoccus TaxID=57495 RepID=UPI00093D205E|nr:MULTISPECIES: MFS transporter [Dermacoccus]MBO1758170.1 MFS transporter [Dermacoccus sp. NHGro5]TCJ92881.1 MFS transporter [Dermacoccus sp. SAI-028]
MTGTQAPPATSPTDDQLRATRLFLLAAGLFVFLTAEMYPVGAMPDMTRDLGESDAAVGRLVTWYAVGVGVAAIPLVMLTRRMPRRRVIVACLLALFVSMAMAALAPSLLVVTIARFIGAAAHDAIFAVVPVAAASLARRGAEAKSVASAFLGASVGVVAGPPFVAAVSDHLGWRVASGIIAALAQQHRPESSRP